MRLFFTLWVLLWVPVAAHAEDLRPAKSFVSASEESIGQIEEMHHHAEDLILQNDFNGAIDVLDEILLLEPDDEVAYAQMGHCYMILGNFARAEQAFQNALHINPDNETANLGLQKIKDPDGVLTQKEIPLEMPGPVLDEPLPAETAAVETPPVKTPTFEENIQQALKNAGLYEGPVDGSIGPASRKAIESFQSSRGLKVDGKVGPETWAALQAYLELENPHAQ